MMNRLDTKCLNISSPHNMCTMHRPSDCIEKGTSGCNVLRWQNLRTRPTYSPTPKAESHHFETGISFYPVSIGAPHYPVLRLDSPVSKLDKLQYGVRHVVCFTKKLWNR